MCLMVDFASRLNLWVKCSLMHIKDGIKILLNIEDRKGWNINCKYVRFSLLYFKYSSRILTGRCHVFVHLEKDERVLGCS